MLLEKLALPGIFRKNLVVVANIGIVNIGIGERMMFVIVFFHPPGTGKTDQEVRENV